MADTSTVCAEKAEGTYADAGCHDEIQRCRTDAVAMAFRMLSATFDALS
jgi:hypothetical protein